MLPGQMIVFVQGLTQLAGSPRVGHVIKQCAGQLQVLVWGLVWLAGSPQEDQSGLEAS